MKYLYLFLFLILFSVFSCKNNAESSNQETKDSLIVNANRITNTISETLSPKAKKELANWQEYNDVDEFIIDYYNITISEALTKAEALEGMVKLMKDTIRVQDIDKPNVIARFNVLHNETLRLADMATMSSILDEEVVNEVSQIIEVYASLNSKINTIYRAQDLEEALEVDTEKPIEIVVEDDNGGKIIKSVKTTTAKKRTTIKKQ